MRACTTLVVAVAVGACTGSHDDGCTAKETAASSCEDGAYVAYRFGERNDSCTLRTVW